MHFKDHEPTEEERAGVKAISEEYPTASKVLQAAFHMIDNVSDDDETKIKIMLGFELGLRSATGMDPEILRQVIELMDRGRAKVGNQETAMITNLLASLVQMASHE